MIKYLFFLALSTSNLLSQTNDEFLFKPKIKIGFMFPGTTSWWLAYESQPIKPSYYAGFGVVTKDIFYIDNVSINFEVEVSYGRASTGAIEYKSKISEFENTSIPIIFWSRIKTGGNIVPYFKIGFGSERTQFKKNDGNYPEDSYDFKEWFFCWALGGGIDINYLTPIELSFFVDAIVKEKGLKKVMPDSRNGATFSGISVGYKF